MDTVSPLSLFASSRLMTMIIITIIIAVVCCFCGSSFCISCQVCLFMCARRYVYKIIAGIYRYMYDISHGYLEHTVPMSLQLQNSQKSWNTNVRNRIIYAPFYFLSLAFLLLSHCVCVLVLVFEFMFVFMFVCVLESPCSEVEKRLVEFVFLQLASSFF